MIVPEDAGDGVNTPPESECSMQENPAYGSMGTLTDSTDDPEYSDSMPDIPMEGNPAYGIMPRVLSDFQMSDNPAYSPIIRQHIPMAINPAFTSFTSLISRQDNPEYGSMFSLQSSQLTQPGDDYLTLF